MLRKTTVQTLLLIGLLVLSIASQAGSVSAGINVWTSTGPEGGRINILAIDPLLPTTLYAGTEGGGVFAILQMDVKDRIYLPLTRHGQ